jgi:hypothetical protein
VKVTVSQRGGVVDVDQVTELAHDRARVLEGGEVTADRTLREPVREHLAALAERCATAAVPREGGADVTDEMTTTVRIELDDRLREITYRSGDDVPDEVVALVDAVLETPYRDPGTRWS